MRKTIEGLCAVLGAFGLAYIALECIRYALASGFGGMVMVSIPFALGAFVCLLGLIDNLGISDRIAELIAREEECEDE